MPKIQNWQWVLQTLPHGEVTDSQSYRMDKLADLLHAANLMNLASGTYALALCCDLHAREQGEQVVHKAYAYLEDKCILPNYVCTLGREHAVAVPVRFILECRELRTNYRDTYVHGLAGEYRRPEATFYG